MDIKEQIESVVSKLKGDENLLASFKKEPVKTVEKLLGVDLPDETVQKVVEAVKVKLSADSLAGAASKLGGLFGKKN